MTSDAWVRGRDEPSRHEALFYRDRDGYTSAGARFVAAGVAAGEPVLVAVPGGHGALLRGRLGRPAGVQYVDLAAEPSRPFLDGVLVPFLRSHGGRQARVFAEPVWPDRDPVEVTALIRQEASVNRALAGWPVTVLCAYDAERLDVSVLSFATRTHPIAGDGIHRAPCENYTEPERVIASLGEPPTLWLPPGADPGTAGAETRADSRVAQGRGAVGPVPGPVTRP